MTKPTVTLWLDPNEAGAVELAIDERTTVRLSDASLERYCRLRAAGIDFAVRVEEPPTPRPFDDAGDAETEERLRSTLGERAVAEWRAERAAGVV